MATLLNLALINAVTVLPLALLAFVVSRMVRRPAFTHAVWVLVLVKLITPPLLNLPLTIEVPLATDGAVQVANVAPSARIDVTQSMQAPLARPVDQKSESSLDPENRQPSEAAALSTHKSATQPTAVSARPSIWESCSAYSMRVLRESLVWWKGRPELQSTLLTCWLVGTIFAIAFQFLRAMQFWRRIVGTAKNSPELQFETWRLGKSLGLKRVPQCLIVEAAISPMLWGCGSHAKLLFPSDLADRLDEQARATLLTHELAHYCRGDHWVRLLESIATALFWWHPVIWWARHQIEESEEECCDAWVVSEFPKAPRQYAEALLDTIDFLCERRQTLPPVACGLGQAHFLRRRLTKIMRGSAPKALSQRARYAIAVIAFIVLPLQPFVLASISSVPVTPPSREIAAHFNSFVSVGALSEPYSGHDNESSSMTEPPASLTPRVTPPSRLRTRPGERTWSTAASPNGRFVVRTTTARRVFLTDLTTNSEIDLSEHRITAVAFAPDGEWFAAADQSGRLTQWDSATGALLQTLLIHPDVLRSVAVSAKGDLIAAGSRDGDVLVIDRNSRESHAGWPSYATAVNCVRFSPNGRQLAVATGDWMSNERGEVALLNAVTGQTLTTLNCNTAPGALTFASNDELIVGLWNGRTELWNLVNRQVVGSATADKNVVSAAAFSPDNPVLREVTFLAAESNGTAKISPAALLRTLFGTSADSAR